MNKVILTGRITKNPELKNFVTGSNSGSVVSFSLAVTRTMPNAQGTYETDFFTCVSFNKQAEYIARNIRQGYLLAVDGKLQTRKYNAQDGTTRNVTEVICDSVQLLAKPNGNMNDGTMNQDYNSSMNYSQQSQQVNQQNSYQNMYSQNNGYSQPMNSYQQQNNYSQPMNNYQQQNNYRQPVNNYQQNNFAQPENNYQQNNNYQQVEASYQKTSVQNEAINEQKTDSFNDFARATDISDDDLPF